MKTCCCVLWRMPHLGNYLLSRSSKQKPKLYQVCLLKRDQQCPINMHEHIYDDKQNEIRSFEHCTLANTVAFV